MYRIGDTRGDAESIVSVLESDALSETMAKIEGSRGFGRDPIDAAIGKLGESIPPSLSAKNLEIFWNFNRQKMANMFTYNPVERYRELKNPNEDRIDATPFSVVLACVIQDGNEITLSGRTNERDELPLVDNLGAYLSRGEVIIYGETGDGIAHHAGPDARIKVSSATGNNLGFDSHEEATIYASSYVGENFAPNVAGPIPALRRLHQ